MLQGKVKHQNLEKFNFLFLWRKNDILTFFNVNELLGAYNPLTIEGNIVVNGVLASTYASFDHDLAHIAMFPIQWIPNIIQWIFGQDNGTPAYVTIAKHFGRYFLPLEKLIEKN